MGKISRGGYLLLWWKGDHEPRHIHVRTLGGDKIGRLELETLNGLEGWTPSRKLVKIVEQLKKEGRL